MYLRLIGATAIVGVLASACTGGEPEQSVSSEQAELEMATSVADDLEIEGATVAPRDDLLGGHWNLRPHGLQAWYAGAEILGCASGSGCASGGGVVDPPDVLDILCTEHEFCMDTNIPVDFDRTRLGVLLARYDLGDGEDGFPGVMVHGLGVAVFYIHGDYAAYEGDFVQAVGGYASLLALTPTRPQIDPVHEGPRDGAFLLALAGGAAIAGLVVPAAGAVIAVPFDAVSCEMYPDDCTR